MSIARPGAIPTAGATRQCPHCKSVILESAIRCPSCQHFLKADESAEVTPVLTPLNIEAAVHHPSDGATAAWEYSVVVVVRDDAGKVLQRHVVDVGALRHGEERTFGVSVEMYQTKDIRRGSRAPNKKR